MSQKITHKNLSYDTSLPPFLAALRAQASGATGPDPLLAAHRRSAKKRSSSEEAQDAPLIVDEHGNPIEIAAGGSDDDIAEDEKPASSSKDENTASSNKDERTATIGGRRRKAGKIVGEADDDAKEIVESSPSNKSQMKTKKKTKKIKLSFDEGEG